MPKSSRRTSFTLLTLALASTGLAQAQEQTWRPFLSATPVHQGGAGLDGGGDFSAQGLILRAGVQGDLGRGNRAGLTFSYDYTDYAYSNPSVFGGLAPWKVVQRYGMSIPLSFGLGEGWSVGVSPSIDWFRENGADATDALTWGGIVSATKRYDNGNRLGFGLGVFDRIEETGVFPFLLVDWRIGDRWRLVNPLPAGPAGPAGLELEYRLDGGWNVGLGAAWRSARFRLSQNGPVPNGIGEERGAPVFIRATRAFGEQTSLNIYAGVVTAGELRVEDASGNKLTQVDFDTAPFIGATLSARF
mgnify:CR=1 FL=1